MNNQIDSNQAIRDVFISYSHKDRRIVDMIIKKFQEYKITYWMDCENVVNNWGLDVRTALKESRLVLLILTHNSIISQNILREIQNAADIFQTKIFGLYDPFVFIGAPRIMPPPIPEDFEFYRAGQNINQIRQVNDKDIDELMNRLIPYIENKRQLHDQKLISTRSIKINNKKRYNDSFMALVNASSPAKKLIPQKNVQLDIPVGVGDFRCPDYGNDLSKENIDIIDFREAEIFVKIGDRIRINYYCEKVGYLLVLYCDNDNVNSCFKPSRINKSYHTEEGIVIIPDPKVTKSIKIKGPKGVEKMLFIHTREPLVFPVDDTQVLEFSDEVLDNIKEQLEKMNKEDWSISSYSIFISEKKSDDRN